MSAHSNAAPVIIKKKKVVGGDGHHGGAWKVAYADFVTAMMAFFLLMWLLNATTEKQRKGIADYFSPTIPISRVSGGGDGQFGGDSVFSEDTLPQNGIGATNLRPTESRQARGESGLSATGAEEQRIKATEDTAFREMAQAMMGRGGESAVMENLLQHVVTRVTDEGLIFEIFDRPGLPMFEPGTVTPTPLARDIVALLAEVSTLVSNPIAIEGHISTQPVVLAENPVWNLSAGRADAIRLALQGAGMDTERVSRITGHADREPVSRNPMSVRNNRLEIVFLRAIPEEM